MVWGLKRSGIHLLVNWLFANLGASVKEELTTTDLPRQLHDGFCDRAAGVAFFNNCGWLYSRQLGLGPLTAADLERAAAGQPTTIFGLEDCALRWSSMTASVPDQRNVLLLRDPLNNLASRLEGSTTMPGQLRTDEAFLDLYAEYATEVLGRTAHLPHRTVVSFNRFVVDPGYRDGIAEQLGVPNRDEVSEVSPYGGGSSFSSGSVPSSPDSLMTRYQQRPLPPRLVELLLARPVIAEVCETVFGYDLARLAGAR